jgi:hypothetical protein
VGDERLGAREPLDREGGDVPVAAELAQQALGVPQREVRSSGHGRVAWARTRPSLGVLAATIAAARAISAASDHVRRVDRIGNEVRRSIRSAARSLAAEDRIRRHLLPHASRCCSFDEAVDRS